MKRVVPILLSAVMMFSLLASCGNKEKQSEKPQNETTEAVESEETTKAEESEATTEAEGEEELPTDGYIEAPYAADAAPEEYLEPVFYENEDGPRISVVYNGVIAEGGKYFRDSNNNKELDPFEDWRLSTEERVADLVSKMTQDQRIGLLMNSLVCSPGVISADEVYDGGKVDISKLVTLNAEDSGEEEGGFMAMMKKPYVAANILDNYTRSGVIRKDTDVETGALFNNTLNMLAEYVGASKGEVTIPYVLISNPMNDGYPLNIGFTAAVAGDGNADALKAWAEVDAQIWNAKGIRQMYGPQIDLVTDPRWSRNATTYGESPEVMAQIATALVTGYQSGTDGAQEGDVALIMKHFPGDGAAYNGHESHSWIGQWRVYSTENSLEKYQLVGFQAAIDAGLAGIMPGYSRPAVDARNAPQTVNGTEIKPEALANAYNPVMLDTLLKEAMGFDGFINSDSGIINTQYFGLEDLSIPERFAAAINAGCDVIGDGFSPILDYSPVEEAVSSGGVTDEALDRATTNRMKSWLDLGMFDNPYRDPAESKAVGEELAATREESKVEFNRKSLVLMKNSEETLPLKDKAAKIYVEKFTGTAKDTEDTVADELEAMGYTIVDKYDEADVAILMISPTALANGVNHLQVLELVEDLEVDEYLSDNSIGALMTGEGGAEEIELTDPRIGKKTGDTVEVTNVADIGKVAKIADAVHANGGKVIATLEITSPWILNNLEPYCDALLGEFRTSQQAIADVLTGEYNPTGKLPVTMVAGNEVIAVEEKTLDDGNTYDVCVSPNDVPGFEKEQYMDPEVLASSPSGSYAYKDADGNFYWFGFGLSY